MSNRAAEVRTRQVLCYGDSNAWGSDPADDERRFEWSVRWPGVLQRELGEAYQVLEVGLGSRHLEASHHELLE